MLTGGRFQTYMSIGTNDGFESIATCSNRSIEMATIGRLQLLTFWNFTLNEWLLYAAKRL
jgi:hypothetical protein